MIENFAANCVCGGTRERPQPDDCERCRFVVALAAETKRADEAVREVERLRVRDQQWQENTFVALTHCEAVGADKAAAMFRSLLFQMQIEEPPCQTT